MAEDKNQEDSDNFGLPDIEYKPLEELDSSKSKEESAPQEETSSRSQEPKSDPPPTYYEEEEESGSSSGVIIFLIVALVVLVGGFLTYKYVWVPKKEKARLAQLAAERAEAKKKATADSLARVAEEEKARLAAANAKPAEGTIETLTDRTGRYYVVVSSSVDGDLAMDRAKKLSAEGKSCKIIPPFGKWKYYRLCIGDFESFASAQSSADGSKADYGDALWVLKY